MRLNELWRVAFVLPCLWAAAALAAATYRFDIPSQELGEALRAFGQASNQQLVFDETTVRGKISAELKGELSAEEGLRRLLTGSGLDVRQGESGVWVIESA